MKNHFKSLTVAITCMILSGTAFAQVQKISDSQETGVRAPSGIKIEGKATEWGPLQATNKATQIMYTVANDDSTLYLVVQSNIPSITSKILRGGITFAVNTQGKKKEKESVAITYPITVRPTTVTTSVGGRASGVERQMVSMAVGGAPIGPAASSADAKKRSDSLAFVNNNRQIERAKDIKVKGIPAITDSLLSIYNDEGIKARATYDESKTYTYELAIPFKYLGIDIKSPKEFLFNVKLNGLDMALPMGASITFVSGNGGGGGSSDLQSMMSATDFWGKYTPIKK